MTPPWGEMLEKTSEYRSLLKNTYSRIRLILKEECLLQTFCKKTLHRISLHEADLILELSNVSLTILTLSEDPTTSRVKFMKKLTINECLLKAKLLRTESVNLFPFIFHMLFKIFASHYSLSFFPSLSLTFSSIFLLSFSYNQSLSPSLPYLCLSSFKL